jgi:hypothetical protein
MMDLALEIWLLQPALGGRRSAMRFLVLTEVSR